MKSPVPSPLKGLSLPFIAVCAALLIGACAQAVKTAEPEPLLGSWQRVDMDPGSTINGIKVQSETVTLTFTKSRFIYHEFTELEGGDVSVYEDSGAWDSTDTTITKTARGWETIEDIFRQTDELASIKKEYVWDDAERTSLSVHIWNNLNRPASRFEQYTRLEPLAGGITGVWRSIDETTEIAIGDDRIEVSGTLSSADGSEIPYTFAGGLRHDPDEGFLFVTVTSSQGVPTIAVGHELKFAYAQTGSNTVLVSDFLSERRYDEVKMMWVDRTDPPYRAFGAYWINLVKQQ